MLKFMNTLILAVIVSLINSVPSVAQGFIDNTVTISCFGESASIVPDIIAPDSVVLESERTTMFKITKYVNTLETLPYIEPIGFKTKSDLTGHVKYQHEVGWQS